MSRGLCNLVVKKLSSVGQSFGFKEPGWKYRTQSHFVEGGWQKVIIDPLKAVFEFHLAGSHILSRVPSPAASTALGLVAAKKMHRFETNGKPEIKEATG